MDTTPSVKPVFDPAMAQLLTSALTHGLRTPLHSLLGFLELMATAESEEEVRHLLGDARDGAEDLLSASDRLGFLIRLLGGAETSRAESIELAQLLPEAATVAGRHCPVRVQVNPYVPDRLYGDADALRHVLAELVSNGVRHGARNMTLSAQRVNAFGNGAVRVRFTVHDNGAGMSQREIEQLTAALPDPRADRLELFLARQLADRLGGQLNAVQGLGRGTTITLDVDLLTQPVGTGKATDAEPAAASLRVLLVEDNPVNVVLTQRQLTRLGHKLDTVVTGQAAVAALRDGDFDVALVDRHLPDLDGLDVVRRVRAAEAQGRPGRRIPLIAVTADATPGHREECLAAGMDAFLTKPLQLEDLRATLTAVVAGHAPPDQDLPHLDTAALQRLSHTLDGDSPSIARLIDTYLAELPRRRQRLQLTVRRQAARPTAAAAESLRAASELVGATRLAYLCAQIRHAADSDDLATAEALMADMADTCQETLQALKGASATLVGR